MRNLAKYALKYTAYLLHICGITEICGVNDACTCLRWTKCAEMLKNAMRMRKYAKYAIICKFFENAIICGKICDMWIFAKSAIAYAIACSHITGIPN